MVAGIAAELVEAALLKASDGFSKARETVGVLAFYAMALLFLSRAAHVGRVRPFRSGHVCKGEEVQQTVKRPK